LLELNELVNEAVKAMKERGLESPYLKAFVVARINPRGSNASRPPISMKQSTR
jgi:ParB family chromosome partitioning protein